MFTTLLCLGLVGSAFAFFPIASVDLREIKMTTALVFALSLGIVELYQHGIKPLKNKWLLILVFYILVSVFISPAPLIMLVGIDVSNFWAWQPFAQMMVFLLMISAIASHEFSDQEMKRIFNTISWCGTFMAFYVILQRLHMDQFFVAVSSNSPNDSGPYAGFTGNPTLVAPYIAMTTPFIIHQRKWWMLPIIVLGVFFPHARATWIALSFGILFIIASKGKYQFISCLIIALALSASVGFLYFKSHSVNEFFNDHERIPQWIQIVKDIKNPISKDVPNSYPLTGHGLGSFKFVYHVQNNLHVAENRFHQAHNDYLEFTYSCGIMGLFLLLSAISWMFYRNYSLDCVFQYGEDDFTTTFLSSFVIVAIVAFFTFIWQIGTEVYLTACLIGFLHNEKMSLQRGNE